jgi:hypothetical protein
VVHGPAVIVEYPGNERKLRLVGTSHSINKYLGLELWLFVVRQRPSPSHVTCTWPIFRPNERSIGRKVDFATRWQVRGGHVPILVHWGVNRHTVDKLGGLSVIIPNKYLGLELWLFVVREYRGQTRNHTYLIKMDDWLFSFFFFLFFFFFF